MLEDLENLIELQRIDNRINEINKMLSNVPEYIAEIQGEYDTVNQKFTSLNDQLAKLRSENTILNENYNNKKILLDKSHKKLSTVKNTKEYESVLKELDTLKKEIADSESKLLEVSYQIESTEADLSNISGRKQELDQKYEELQKKRDQENQEVTEELKSLEEERKKVADRIKKQYLSKYEVIRKARSNLAIVRIEKEICSGCYMKVPPQLYVEVKKNSSVQQCPNCQRFLYYKEEEQQ